MTDTPPFICTPGVVKAEMCDRIIALGDALPSGAPQVVRSDSESGKPLVRKLSFSLQLSNDHDYVGGDFQVRNADRSVDEALWTRMRQRGSFIVFPSLTVHQVTPVIFGERRSLVGWVLGTASDEDLRHDIASRYEVPEK